MKENASEELSTKNTKNEILSAYQQLLDKINLSKEGNRKEEVEQKKKQEITKQVDQYSPDKIIKSLADIKLQVTQFFEMINEQIMGEYKKLKETQQAVEIEDCNLCDKYEINTCADTLAALLLGQKQEREAFKQEMEQKRNKFEQEMKDLKEMWEKDKESFETEQEEYQKHLIKKRQREEEEYKYKLNIEKQKEKDQYELKKEVLERELEDKKQNVDKELEERIAGLASQEQELIALRQKAEKFPKELEDAIEKAGKKAIEKLEQEYNFSVELKEKEIEGEKKLTEQIIENYRTKIKEMESQIARLVQKTDQAGQQVQDIAVKAIEGASGTAKWFNNNQTAIKQEKTMFDREKV